MPVQAQLVKLLDKVRGSRDRLAADPGEPRWHSKRSGPEQNVAPLTKSLAREVGWTDEARAAAAAARASKAGGLTADERKMLDTARQTMALPVEQTEHEERVWAQRTVNELGAKEQAGKLGKLGGTKGLSGLTVAERHQLNVARQTLRMSPEMAHVMGGPTQDEARDTVKRLTNKAARVSRGARDSAMRDMGLVKVKGELGGTYWESWLDEARRWWKLMEGMSVSAAAPLMRRGARVPGRETLSRGPRRGVRAVLVDNEQWADDEQPVDVDKDFLPEILPAIPRDDDDVPEEIPSEDVPTVGPKQQYGPFASEDDANHDVPTASFKSDLKRKLSLRQVMGKPKDDQEEGPKIPGRDLNQRPLGDEADDEDMWPGPPERFRARPIGEDGRDEIVSDPSKPVWVKPKRTKPPLLDEDEDLFDDLFGDGGDNEQQCHDEDGNVVDCDDPDAVDASSEVEPDDFGHAIDTALYKTKAPADIPEGQQQYSKEEVNYRWASIPGKSCGDCKFFIEPGACQLVAGLIRPVDVCDKFQPKEKDMAVRAMLVTRKTSEARRGGEQVPALPAGSSLPTIPSGLSEQYKGLAMKRQSEMKRAVTAYSRSGGFGSKSPFRITETEVAPPGWEGTVKAMKKHPEIDNPWALSWYMKGIGDKPQK